MSNDRTSQPGNTAPAPAYKRIVLKLSGESFQGSQGIGIDGLGAAQTKYAELPLVKPSAATFSYAILAVRQNGDGPRTPDKVVIAVMQGPRVFVASTPASAKVRPIPACDRIWKTRWKQDQEAANSNTHVGEDAEAAFLRCYRQRAKRQGFFAAITGQAQALVDRVTSR